MTDSEIIFDTIKHYTGHDLPQDGRFRGSGAAMLFERLMAKGQDIHRLEKEVRNEGQKARVWIESTILALDPESEFVLTTVPAQRLDRLADNLKKLINEVHALRILMDAFQELAAEPVDMGDLLA